MRVTAQTKEATRQRILRAARRLLAEKGFEATTTRDIARAADVASGTLFNYFPTKEAILASLAGAAVGDAQGPESAAAAGESLEEDLFALLASGLRKLKHLRTHLPVLLETYLSPLADSDAGGTTALLRVGHLEAVAALASRHGFHEMSPTALQLYWTLYTGVLVFWANDRSPRQEDTLALIDDSLDMFVGWLREHARTTRHD